MDGTPDSTLLNRYLRDADEAAFEELVQRHCTLVWATAHRVCRNPDAARDITQTVFCLLVRKASRLAPGTVLAGWLHRTAWLEAVKQIRNEARRTDRERTAMNDLDPQGDAVELDRAAIVFQPLLDQALADLSDDDRHAVILRYLSGRSLAEIGSELGTNEDAAQKRVSRALEKLRGWFRQRGVSAGEGVVAAALGLAGTQAAPAGLATSVSAAALAGGGVTAATLSGIIFMKSNVVLGTVTALAVASLVWQQTRLNHLTRENAELRRQPPATPATPPPVTVIADDSRQQEDRAELLRLRSEVARLRQETSGTAGRSAENAEARAAQAEATAAALREEVAFRQRRELLISTGKNLGMAARIFSTAHENRIPATAAEMQEALKEAGMDEGQEVEGGAAPESFELFAHPRPPRLDEPVLILLREREMRRIPTPVLREGELTTGTPFAIPLKKGWERAYVMIDGSVQTISSPDGDFSAFERDGTARATPSP